MSGRIADHEVIERLRPATPEEPVEVVRARHRVLGLERVIEVADADALDPGRRRRLERRATSLAGLRHPGLLQAVDLAERDGRVALLFEPWRARPLGGVTAAGLARTAGALADVAAGLAHLHEMGLAHGAVDAGAVHVRRDGRAKLGPPPPGWSPGSPPPPADDLVALGRLIEERLVPLVASLAEEERPALDELVRGLAAPPTVDAADAGARLARLRELAEASPTGRPRDPHAAPRDLVGETVAGVRVVGLVRAMQNAILYEAVREDEAPVGLLVVRASAPARAEAALRQVEAFAPQASSSLAVPTSATTIGGSVAFVVELVEGQRIAERVAAGRLPPTEAVALAANVLDALAPLHAAGLAHGNIRPTSVVLRGTRGVTLTDALITWEPTSPPGAAAATMDTEPHFQAPEALEGAAPSPASDVWSVGSLLFYLLTGDAPFRGAVAATVAASIRSKMAVPSPSTRVPSLGPAVDRAVARLLDRDADRRPADAAAARAVLEDALGELRRSRTVRRERPPTSDRRVADFVYQHELPHPIASAYRLARIAVGGQDRLQHAIWAFETTVRYLACIAVVCYLDARVEDAATDEAIAALRRRAPTIGGWIGLLRSTTAALATTSAGRDEDADCFIPDLVRVLQGASKRRDALWRALNDFPAKRNTLSHSGRPPSERRARDLARELTTDLRCVLGAVEFLCSYPLCTVTRGADRQRGLRRWYLRRLHGHAVDFHPEQLSTEDDLPERTPFLLAPTLDRILVLEPFLVIGDCPIDDHEHLFLLNRIRGPKFHYHAAYWGHEWQSRGEHTREGGWDALIDALIDRRPEARPSIPIVSGTAPQARPRTTLTRDELIDERYRVIGLIKQGGMADVYEVTDDLDRRLALKMLPPECAGHADIVNRFVREARTLAKLDRPGIVRIMHWGSEGDRHFIVMPFAEGGDLRDQVKGGVALPPERAAAIAIELVEALSHVHACGEIHRDLKPSNILFDGHGRVLLADFGIAKALGGGTRQMTRTGEPMGTPGYMPPEQARGDRDLSPATDVWALGRVIVEMLAGRPDARERPEPIAEPVWEVLRATQDDRPEKRPPLAEIGRVMREVAGG